MTIRFPVTSRNAGLDTQLDRMDAGTGPGTIKVYSGAQPTDGDATATGTLLATFTCGDPAWNVASGGVKTLKTTPALTTTAAAAGSPGWARCQDSTGANVFDGSVGTSGADFTISTGTLTQGQTVNLTSGTVTDPA